MGLRAIAAADAKAILEDSASGFGWPLSLTSPAGVTSMLTGFASDVSESVDPETGQAVSARRASVAISLLSLAELPAAVVDSDARPWRVAMNDVSGVPGTWKVIEVRPDRALGLVVLLLEEYASSD